MRVIITGGTGLIGSALATDLAGAGHEVILLSRNPGRVQGRLRRGVRAEAWDGRSVAGWGALADGAGAIVNLAGENIGAGRWTTARKQAILRSRVDAGKAVTQAVQQAGQKPGVVLQSSAVGYYGPRGEETITEDSPAGQDFLSDVCRQWEDATAGVETLGVRRAVIRTGVVLDTHQGALPRMALPVKLFVGGRLGSGKQWFSWIHLIDLVAAMRFLIENPSAQGAFNLVAPNPLTNAQFTRVLGGVLKRPTFLFVPAFAIRLLFGEMATTILNGQRVVPGRLQQMGFQFKYSQAQEALQALYN